MDLRQLEILKAVAETGSFTGAGRRLHVSQSAISRQILLLEAELNEPLFWRIKRKVKITPPGRRCCSSRCACSTIFAKRPSGSAKRNNG